MSTLAKRHCQSRIHVIDTRPYKTSMTDVNTAIVGETNSASEKISEGEKISESEKMSEGETNSRVSGLNYGLCNF